MRIAECKFQGGSWGMGCTGWNLRYRIRGIGFADLNSKNGNFSMGAAVWVSWCGSLHVGGSVLQVAETESQRERAAEWEQQGESLRMGVLVRESPSWSVRVSQGWSREQEQLDETCGVRAAGWMRAPRGKHSVGVRMRELKSGSPTMVVKEWKLKIGCRGEVRNLD